MTIIYLLISFSCCFVSVISNIATIKYPLELVIAKQNELAVDLFCSIESTIIDQACISLIKLFNSEVLIENNCLDFNAATSFRLSNLPTGFEYELRAVVSGFMISRKFRVLSYDSVTPIANLVPHVNTLTSVNQEWKFISNYYSNLGDLELYYELDAKLRIEEANALEVLKSHIAEYNICMRLQPIESISQQVMEVCTIATYSSSTQSITVYGVPEGSYNTTIFTAQRIAPSKAYYYDDPSTNSVSSIRRRSVITRVIPLFYQYDSNTYSDMHPQIAIKSPHPFEFGYHIDASMHSEKVSFELQYIGISSVLSQLQVCMKLQLITDTVSLFEAFMKDAQCFPITDTVFTLTNIQQYKAVFIHYRLFNDKNVIFPYQFQANMEVHQYEELVPSYEWKALHAWHTIPNGLTTR